MLFAGRRTHLQTYKLTNSQTYTQIFSQYSGISSHSFGRSYFFRAATAFDIFGTDNAEELLTCGF